MYLYMVNNIEEFYDTLKEGHRIYLGEMIKKCVVPSIIGYMETHRRADVTFKGVPAEELETRPYYLYKISANYQELSDGSTVRVSMYSPNAVKITLFNEEIFDEECFERTKADGTIFFIPEYVSQKF